MGGVRLGEVERSSQRLLGWSVWHALFLKICFVLSHVPLSRELSLNQWSIRLRVQRAATAVYDSSKWSLWASVSFFQVFKRQQRYHKLDTTCFKLRHVQQMKQRKYLWSTSPEIRCGTGNVSQTENYCHNRNLKNFGRGSNILEAL